MPPLRERDKDCILLAGYFLEKNQHQLGVGRLRLTESASAQLERYDWPGNVRELEHLLSRAALKALAGQSPRPRIVSLSARHFDFPVPQEKRGGRNTGGCHGCARR